MCADENAASVLDTIPVSSLLYGTVSYNSRRGGLKGTRFEPFKSAPFMQEHYSHGRFTVHWRPLCKSVRSKFSCSESSYIVI
jgi:hypothetical protein